MASTSMGGHGLSQMRRTPQRIGQSDSLPRPHGHVMSCLPCFSQEKPLPGNSVCAAIKRDLCEMSAALQVEVRVLLLMADLDWMCVVGLHKRLFLTTPPIIFTTCRHVLIRLQSFNTLRGSPEVCRSVTEWGLAAGTPLPLIFQKVKTW